MSSAAPEDIVMNSLAFTFIAEAKISGSGNSHCFHSFSRWQVGSFFNEPLVSRMAATSVQACQQ